MKHSLYTYFYFYNNFIIIRSNNSFISFFYIASFCYLRKTFSVSVEQILVKGNTVLLAGGRTLTFDARLTAVLDPIEQTDNQLKNAWQRDVLYRVCFSVANVSEGTFDMVIS